MNRLGLALWLVMAGWSAAQPSPRQVSGGVPDGAAVSLKLPPRAVLGETIDGTFVVTNVGSTVFRVGLGGDYRGSAIHARLKVVVTDSTGRELPDRANTMNFGGIVQDADLGPGESRHVECPLHEYVAFVEPGIYTVVARHDLGWVKKVESAPAATATIEMVAPTERSAAERVRALCVAGNAENLTHLRLPVYLPALVAEAKAGRAIACVGIMNIPTDEANLALLELARSEKQEVANAAVAMLTRRLPWLGTTKEPAIRSFMDRGELRAEILKAWRPEFDEALLAIARTFLERGEAAILSAKRNPSGSGSFRLQDFDGMSMGAQLIEARGTAREASVLLAATQRALAASWPDRAGPDANVLDAPAPLHALIRAIDALRGRGWRTNGVGGAAVILAHFRQLADPGVPRPANDRWKQSVHAYMDAKPPILRENAIRAIPQPVSEEWDKALLEALEDPDWGVVRAACEAAGASGRKVFTGALAHVVETIHESFTQRAAHKAAVKLGARTELWEAWCEVIADKEKAVVAVQNLAQGVIDFPPCGAGGGNMNVSREQLFTMRDAWRSFLKQHHDLLESGGRVPRDDATVAPLIAAMDLGAIGYVAEIHLQDGTDWPPRKK